jgi:hypothetical protein
LNYPKEPEQYVDHFLFTAGNDTDWQPLVELLLEQPTLNIPHVNEEKRQ